MSIRIPNPIFSEFSGIGDLGTLAVAARKSDLDQRKMSADMARQAWEDAHAYAKEQAAQLLPGSDFQRAAQMSAGMGNAVGAPYGLHVDEETTKDMPVDHTTPATSEAAAFLQNGGLPLAKGEKDPLLDADTSKNPARGTFEPLQGPTPSGAPLQDVGEPQAPETPFDAEAATTPREKAIPTTTRRYAQVIGGQRFELPKEAPTDIFPEHEYNAMVDKLIATGKFDEASATKQVEAIRKADFGEQGKDRRFDAGLGQKQATQLTREEQIKLREQGFDVSRENSQGRDRAIMGSAATRAGSGGPMGDPKLINAYSSYSKAAQASALMKQDQQGQRMFDRIAAELDPENPNALNHQMANHSLAAISVSTGGGAGRVPVSVIHDVRNAYSLATSAKNWLYKQAHGGQNSPEVVAVMRAAQAKLLKLSEAERENDFRVWNAKAGYGSAWAHDPMTRPLVDAEADSVRAQLHLPPLADSPPETPYLPASPEAPQAPSRAPHHKASPAPGGMDDAAAVKMAQERYTKNPNDAVAKQVLKMHGLLK